MSVTVNCSFYVMKRKTMKPANDKVSYAIYGETSKDETLTEMLGTIDSPGSDGEISEDTVSAGFVLIKALSLKYPDYVLIVYTKDSYDEEEKHYFYQGKSQSEQVVKTYARFDEAKLEA